MAETSIEWTHPPGYRGETWNPVNGCEKVSPGCRECYAEKIAARFSKPGQPYSGLVDERGRWTGVIRPEPHKLADPLKRRAPTCWFVNSMSDLFHDDVPDEYIAAVFGVMAATPQHRYIVLTKRAERMLRWFEWVHVHGLSEAGPWPLPQWPLPNVALGVSCEDQQRADERIPHLLETPAAVRLVSAEPLLGPLRIRREWFPIPGWTGSDSRLGGILGDALRSLPDIPPMPGLDWIVFGGESGRNARPCDVDWIRDGVRQCLEAGVPAFVKQLGGWPVHNTTGGDADDVRDNLRLRDRKGGDPAEWPEDLRVREWPEAWRGGNG